MLVRLRDPQIESPGVTQPGSADTDVLSPIQIGEKVVMYIGNVCLP